MIDKNFLVNQLYRNTDLVFSQGPYYLPSRIMSRRSGRVYSIQNSIQDHKKNEEEKGGVSDFLMEFDKWCKEKDQIGRGFNMCEKEMVFLIREKDIGVWKSLYKGDNEERKDRNLFIADLFFPYLNLIIEIDGPMYHEYLDSDKYGYDKARDQFIYSIYGIETVRLNENSVDKRMSAIKRVLRKRKKSEIPAFLDYSDEIARMYFNHTYPESEEVFGILEILSDLPDFYNPKNTSIGLPGNIKTSDIVKESLKEILHDLYGKELHF